MKKLGLIGYPLGHSFSKKYFTEKFGREGIEGWEYENFPIAVLTELQGMIVNEPNLVGFNVTIPYKTDIIAYLDETDEAVTNIGAVNTVTIERKSGETRLKGYNTDIYG